MRISKMMNKYVPNFFEQCLNEVAVEHATTLDQQKKIYDYVIALFTMPTGTTRLQTQIGQAVRNIEKANANATPGY